MRLPERFSLHAEGYYSLDYSGFDMKPHAHDSIEIMCASEGSAEIETDRKYALKKGQLVLLAPNTPHRLKADACKMLNAEFSLAPPEFPDVSGYIRQAAGLFAAVDPVLILEDTVGAAKLLKRLIAELAAGDKAFSDLLTAEFILSCGRLYRTQSPAGNPKVRLAAGFIADNFDGDVSVADVAAFTRLNPTYLQRIFKEETGTTVLEYITALRLDKAKRLMASTNLALTDIAVECGYNNRQNFYAAFVARNGCSPKAYRDALEADRKSKYIRTPFSPKE